MNLRSLALVSPLVLVLGLAACDDRDYEAELAAMQEELALARNDLEAARAENERLTMELDEAQAGPETAAAGAAGGPPMEDLQAEVVLIAERASLALANLNLLEEQAQVDAGEVRQNLEEIVQLSESVVAGVMSGASPPPEPAAGPAAADPTQPPPADAETPAEATGVTPPPEVLEEEPVAPQQ
jgi:hypothetical protein